MLARDFGKEPLTAPGALRAFIDKIRRLVFPRDAEEARQLFRAGQRQSMLARQGGESMLSYISRRRKLLPSLDIIIELCGPMRVELHFELSELSRKPGSSRRARVTAAISSPCVLPLRSSNLRV